MAFKDLSESEKEKIRDLLDKQVPQSAIAKQFSIQQSDVSRLKNNKEYEDYPGIRIRGISRKTREILETIAANKDLKLQAFLKIAIHDIIDNTPERYKRPIQD